MANFLEMLKDYHAAYLVLPDNRLYDLEDDEWSENDWMKEKLASRYPHGFLEVFPNVGSKVYFPLNEGEDPLKCWYRWLESIGFSLNIEVC